MQATCRIACLLLGLVGAAPAVAGSLEDDFREPPIQWKTRPLWFWNAPPNKQQTETLMERCRDAGYYGFGILPTNKMGLAFMSPAYLDRYQEAVDKAAQLGMKMCLYDEFWFPSGSAGDLLASVLPAAKSAGLDYAVYDGAPSVATLLNQSPDAAAQRGVELKFGPVG